MLVNRGLERVLGDLTEIGYDTKWIVMGASDVGANHKRDRIWILGYTNNNGQIAPKISKSLAQGGNDCSTWQKQASKFTRSSEQYAELAHTDSLRELQPKRFEQNKRRWISNSSDAFSNANRTQCEGNKCAQRSIEERAEFGISRWWKTEPNVGRVADGVAARMDRLKAIGNGQVPLCAATAWRILSEPL